MKETNLIKTILIGAAVFLVPVRSKADPSIEITPMIVDFGWCPDNAKVTGEITIKNVTNDVIALNAVQPSCGCTATNFTPANLSGSDLQKIQLTFNTRGYSGVKFNKPVEVKAGNPEVGTTIHLAGYVLDPQAKVLPVGTGIAAFEPGSSETKKIISIQNKTNLEVALTVVQEPAEWAKVKLKNDKIEPGKTVELEVSVQKPFDDLKETSITYEASNITAPERFTVAIRTGPGPIPVRRIQPPAEAGTAASSSPSKSATPEKSPTPDKSKKK